MRAAITKGELVLARLREEHRRNVEECKPLLDKSIPLGRSEFHAQYAVRRYYEEKARRGLPETYPGLH